MPVRESLQAVPALDSFAPDVSPEVVEQAPRMERDGLADLQQHNQRRDRIDRFWQEPTGWAAPTASRFRVRDRLSS